MTRQQQQDDSYYVMATGQEVLGLDDDQTGRLFSPYWFTEADGKFSLLGISDPVKRSAIAVKRINHFIKTRGAE